ncbi:MAG TPA: glycosyltransferase family 4 protein [Burkholderiales bacterium]
MKTAQAVAKSGLDVILAHAPAPGGHADPFSYYRVERPANARSVAISRALPAPLDRIESNRLFALRLAKVVLAERPDAVLVRHIKLAALLRRRFPRLPIVYEAHEVFADTAALARRARVERQEEAALRAASAVIANSNGTASRLAQRFGGTAKIEVIPNGVDWRSELPSKDWAGARKLIAYAGSLFPWKGVEDLVLASALLPGCTVTIAGGEPQEVEALRARVSASGAQVVFLGRVDHASVQRLLGASCIAVLPNRADPESAFTSPLKLFEYMAAGCALVASDLPALREILDAGDASFVPAQEPQALASAIRALADDPGGARRMGERLHEKARRYSWDARGERVAALLKRLCA